jgi:hypothetical protein
MTASVHRLQFVHSATSMIMFHFSIAFTVEDARNRAHDPVMIARAVISPARGGRL